MKGSNYATELLAAVLIYGSKLTIQSCAVHTGLFSESSLVKYNKTNNISECHMTL